MEGDMLADMLADMTEMTEMTEMTHSNDMLLYWCNLPNIPTFPATKVVVKCGPESP